ncbi:probable leucine-rich repeat receptor-like protein kinase At1g35710 [Asparagus officinalis]|uniref:probable leucine-rich repeat receptor-like protein kinase At1g35710 n=1 Tax=Asparagus officinalis TaxID=4686 RepID=UPI00098E78C5|nr:probable leucine-rich repeat receptor-like protein kinase At1g35710 [Asparagus officinalis]
MVGVGGNTISGRIPEEIGNLASLTVFGMEEFFLSGTIPTSIGQIQSLQEVYLSGNKLSGENALEGSIPPILGNCQALRLLNLSYNQITVPWLAQRF